MTEEQMSAIFDQEFEKPRRETDSFPAESNLEEYLFYCKLEFPELDSSSCAMTDSVVYLFGDDLRVSDAPVTCSPLRTLHSMWGSCAQQFDLDTVLADDVWRKSSIHSYMECDGEMQSPFDDMNSALCTPTSKTAFPTLTPSPPTTTEIQPRSGFAYNPRRTYRRLQGRLTDAQ
eukprot:CAMPEP_0113720430 /NCGR_PEP_ID=MMETSP0038_2-20120614/36467_1 /TAXON_ID=2898 /ORGANISM="Cryptomonas paramecium" /LENGTH=173 /DNA_ID=CAMNT_0000649115 /DNA_START=56 /DNA_END=574 /DNA_ORIENTATION=- /assembly_acc=CAM_ASM_000170